jgi:hypothetical protein
VTRRRSYELLDLAERAAPVAVVSILEPGDSVRVVAVHGSADDGERLTLWLELLERMDDGTLVGKPELAARGLTDGAWDYRDRIRIRPQHVAEVRTMASLRSVDRKSFERPKARMH